MVSIGLHSERTRCLSWYLESGSQQSFCASCILLISNKLEAQYVPIHTPKPQTLNPSVGCFSRFRADEKVRKAFKKNLDPKQALHKPHGLCTQSGGRFAAARPLAPALGPSLEAGFKSLRHIVHYWELYRDNGKEIGNYCIIMGYSPP